MVGVIFERVLLMVHGWLSPNWCLVKFAWAVVLDGVEIHGNLMF